MNRRLPIGIQDFKKIREDGFLYVDKTAVIHRLINNSGGSFFLSRPRRFGKSLFVNTLEALFKGQKDLFNNLYIADKADWNVNYPVIKLDWTAIGHATKDQLESGIIEILDRIGKLYQVDLKISGNAAKVFEQLIFCLHEKTGRKVVVLVDEYDVPILDNLRAPDEVLEPIREFLQGFYRVLKASDEYLKFVFLTGITKFAKVSIFSALNNMIDITMDNEYATICGLTQKEIEDNFAPYIDIIAKENDASNRDVLDTIQQWYNGFSWDGHTFVYNPFSTLLLFMKKKFENYWFASATPTFLVEIIKERNDIKYLLEQVEIDGTGFDTFDYKALDTKLLLFQTGYLTVKNIKKGRLGIPPVYTLGIPNNEVRNSLFEYMVSSYTSYPVSNTAILRDRMRRQLLNEEEKAFEESAKELFAKIPYQLHIPREAYYHSLLLLWLSLLGFEVQGEVSTNKGRIDGVWTWEDQIIITEVKFPDEGNADHLLQDALNQIREKGYIERYKDNIHKITLLAIGFTGKDIVCKIYPLASFQY
jgi:hypothetical protein